MSPFFRLFLVLVACAVMLMMLFGCQMIPLCHNCNVGIGHLGDQLEGLRAAVSYLERN